MALARLANRSGGNVAARAPVQYSPARDRVRNTPSKNGRAPSQWRVSSSQYCMFVCMRVTLDNRAVSLATSVGRTSRHIYMFPRPKNIRPPPSPVARSNATRHRHRRSETPRLEARLCDSVAPPCVRARFFRNREKVRAKKNARIRTQRIGSRARSRELVSASRSPTPPPIPIPATSATQCVCVCFVFGGAVWFIYINLCIVKYRCCCCPKAIQPTLICCRQHPSPPPPPESCCTFRRT